MKMKKQILLLAAICFSITNTSAATITGDDDTLEPVEVYHARFWDGFYFGAKSGLQIVANGPHSSEIGKNLSSSSDIFGGVEFNPFWGTRVLLGYTRQKAYVGPTGSTFYGDLGEGFGEKFKVNILNGEITPTLNLTNAIWGYKQEHDRKFNAHVFAGIGVMHAFGKSTHSNDAYVSGGLFATYRVADRWNIIAEVADRFCSSSILGYYNAHPTYHFPSAKIGITFKLNRKGFKKISTKPYIAKIENLQNVYTEKVNEVSDLNKTIVTLQDEINGKNREIERLLKEKGFTAVPELPIFFNINSSEVDSRSKIVLEEYCKCIKEVSTDYRIEVTGYCDTKTGSRAYNDKLKVKRAEEVANLISSQYGIPADKITANGGDLDNSPYPEKEYIYSRVAIVKFVKK